MSINLYIILKVIFLSQLLQNFGYIPHVVQYILEPMLHPAVCIPHSPTLNPRRPLPCKHWLILHIVSLLPFCYIH